MGRSEGVGKLGCEKMVRRLGVGFFGVEGLSGVGVGLWEWEGKKKKVCGYGVCYGCVYWDGGCIYRKKCGCGRLLGLWVW